MEELKISWGDSIDVAVKELLKVRDEGKHAFCVFNGVKLYSDDVTIDSAYLDICGCTKAQWDEKLRKYVEESKKRTEENRKNAIENIPNVIEKGEKLIYPFRHEEWAILVEADAKSDYCGLITLNALEIMSAIDEKKSVEELVKMFEKQGHSGRSYSMVRHIVMIFSKKGYPFYKATHYGKWTKEECKAIRKIIQENNEYSKYLQTISSIELSKNKPLK